MSQQKLNKVFFLGISAFLLSSSPLWADVENRITVERVQIPKKFRKQLRQYNPIAALNLNRGWIACDNPERIEGTDQKFTGTYPESVVRLRVEVKNPRPGARYRHTLYFGPREDGLDPIGWIKRLKIMLSKLRPHKILNHKEETLSFESTSSVDHVYLELPTLPDTLPSQELSVVLLTKDLQTKEKALKNLIFEMTPPIVLVPDSDSTRGCRKVHAPILAFPGVKSGSQSIRFDLGSTRSQGIMRGNQVGGAITPFVTAGGISLSVFSGNFSHLSQQTTQHLKTQTESIELKINEPSYVYKQLTEVMVPFNIREFSPCGEVRIFDSAPVLSPNSDWSFHVVPVNGDLWQFAEQPMDDCTEKLGAFRENQINSLKEAPLPKGLPVGLPAGLPAV